MKTQRRWTTGELRALEPYLTEKLPESVAAEFAARWNTRVRVIQKRLTYERRVRGMPPVARGRLKGETL